MLEEVHSKESYLWNVVSSTYDKKEKGEFQWTK